MNMNVDQITIPLAGEYLPAITSNDDERQILQAMIGPAMVLSREAGSFAVTDVTTYNTAAERRQICRKASDRADAFRRTFTDPLNTVVKRWNAFFKAPIDFLQSGADVYEEKLLAYDRAQRRLEEEARRKAELEAANEKARLQREAERTAKQLEKKGEAEAAAEIRQSVPDVPVVPAYVAPVRPQGTSVVTTHKAQCTNLEALIKAVAGGTAPLTLLKCDESALNKYASATRGTIAVPGVRFYVEESVRQRA